MRFNPGCSCCEAAGIAACGFDPIAALWTVTMAGITGTCPGSGGPGTTDCTDQNNDYEMAYAGSDVLGWRDESGINNSLALMRCENIGGTDYMVLTFTADPGFACSGNYRKLKSTFDPLGPNVMTFNAAFADCTGWPATRTVTPG